MLQNLEVGKNVNVGYPTIMNPNRKGKVVGETPTMWKVEILGFIFKPKTSSTGLTHKFTKSRQDHYKTGFTAGVVKKFYKKNCVEVGGDTFLY